MAYPSTHSIWHRLFEQQPTASFIGMVVRNYCGNGAGWRFLHVNAAWEQLTGKTREQGEGTLNTELFPGTSQDWLGVFADMVDSGLPTTFIRRTELFSGWFKVSAFPLGGELFAATFADATEKMLAIEARERSDLKLQAASDLLLNVFRQTPAFMCALRGPQHVFEIVNDRYTDLIGGREVIGRSVAEALPEVVDQGFVDILDRVYANNEPFVGFNVAVSIQPNAEEPPQEHFLDFVYLPLHDSVGAVSGVLLHGVDQTQRQRAEDELRAVATELSEMDRRKSEFLATLAHELRNPLAPLRNGLQIMRVASDNPDVMGRTRDMMERQVSSLVRLVDDLLDVARISGGKIELRRERVSVQTLVARAVETATPGIAAQRHALTLNIPTEPIYLDVDATRIAQVLANLLGNAAKYTPPGGHLAIDAVELNGEAMISVSDDGIGIPSEAIGAVFEMFSQVRENLSMAQGGLGIGLALSRRLAELHAGTLEAKSAGTGKGSRFTLRLPVATQVGTMDGHITAAEESAGTRAAPVPTRRLRALVVDDNLDAGDSLALRLELAGHEARLARDGRSGLAVAREFSPDVAFLDIGMPGMNGYELANAIRSSGRCEGILLVALTGWGTTRDVARSAAAGFDEHLTKPAQVDDVDRVMAHVGRRVASAHP